MKEFEVRFDGIPVGIAHATELPKSLGPDSQFTLKCDVSIQRSPTMTMTVESPADPVWDKFMKEWLGILQKDMPQSIGFKVDPQYAISGMFQPAPKLIAPYKLKWHSHGVIVIGADEQHFYADDTLRSARQAHKWAKRKLWLQRKNLETEIGTLTGATFHTGLPRLSDIANPTTINQEEMLARLKEFSDANPGLDFRTPIYELNLLQPIPMNTNDDPDQQREITFAVDWGNVIRKEDHAVIKINPGT
jgi:hypothetical protein